MTRHGLSAETGLPSLRNVQSSRLYHRDPPYSTPTPLAVGGQALGDGSPTRVTWAAPGNLGLLLQLPSAQVPWPI